MTGTEFRRLREQAGISREQVAGEAGVAVDLVHAWERSGRVPRGSRLALDHALWTLERDAALAKAGVPRCPRAVPGALPAPRDQAAVDDLLRHLDGCGACRAHDGVVRTRVRPEPVTGGILAQAMSYVPGYGLRHSGWRASACAGALLVLALSGTGIVALLAAGLFTLSPALVAAALGVFLVCTVSGAVGGITHHLTRRMRRRGAAGRYASATLSVYAYLVAALALFTGGSLLVGVPVDEGFRGMLADPVGWAIFAVVGAFFGAALAGAERSPGR
jgi:transcriptional regulator with XRE-family HTH domain